MKQQKDTINPNDLPQRFGWSTWTILYLIVDKFEPNRFVWWSFAIALVLWTLLFWYIKSTERNISIVQFKQNIDRWISES